MVSAAVSLGVWGLGLRLCRAAGVGGRGGNSSCPCCMAPPPTLGEHCCAHASCSCLLLKTGHGGWPRPPTPADSAYPLLSQRCEAATLRRGRMASAQPAPFQPGSVLPSSLLVSSCRQWSLVCPTPAPCTALICWAECSCCGGERCPHSSVFTLSPMSSGLFRRVCCSQR